MSNETKTKELIDKWNELLSRDNEAWTKAQAEEEKKGIIKYHDVKSFRESVFLVYGFEVLLELARENNIDVDTIAYQIGGKK